MKTRSAVALALVVGFAIGSVAVQSLRAAAKPSAYVVTEIGSVIWMHTRRSIFRLPKPR